ncbi:MULTISPECIES: carbohydrate ABC transporter permease [unclassified Roseitalea]|uniref:carbohydrate ABC transporter permease n=1 Tax=unclassified Roseitalea TaxID=2639107 RepID=UPI00273CFA92|nr:MULTISPECIES: carbohydrate ABC transporter permease [unclassified Roseitalea]
MEGIAGSKSHLTWAVHITVALLVIVWLFPTVGLFVSSFRTADQISTSGWWAALFQTEQNMVLRAQGPDAQVDQDGVFVISGNIFDEEDVAAEEITAWGLSSRDIAAYQPGETVDLEDGQQVTLDAVGNYRFTSPTEFEGRRGERLFVTATTPPTFTLENYDTVLGENVIERMLVFLVASAAAGAVIYFLLRSSMPVLSVAISIAGALVMLVLLINIFGASTGTVAGAETTDNISRAFFNTLTVVIPATIIPILIAAFAAYALAWMEFPGRALLIACVVALLVVPLQLALIPLLQLHNAIGIGKGYLGVWLAHTGFGLPLAIYLLRNYMVGLPRDIIENARVDGATDFQIFVRIILPLSFPALASFAIFQFLWTWNDLLVALVFLIDATGETTVMTRQIVELLGTRGGNWEILATAAFVSIAVPLVVFFAMQRYLVRGLLAGSVK